MTAQPGRSALTPPCAGTTSLHPGRPAASRQLRQALRTHTAADGLMCADHIGLMPEPDRVLVREALDESPPLGKMGSRAEQRESNRTTSYWKSPRSIRPLATAFVVQSKRVCSAPRIRRRSWHRCGHRYTEWRCSCSAGIGRQQLTLRGRRPQPSTAGAHRRIRPRTCARRSPQLVEGTPAQAAERRRESRVSTAELAPRGGPCGSRPGHCPM